jgi:hypothetical protein
LIPGCSLSFFLFGLEQIEAAAPAVKPKRKCYTPVAMPEYNSYFSQVAGPPRPLEIDHVFGGSQAGFSYTSNTSELLQQLMAQIDDQSSVLTELVGALSGQTNGSALQSVLSGTTFGGSVLGGIANAAKGGFSWKSVLSDVFPVGGLISDIAGLFSSAPTPPPLNEYAAPPSLNFNAVLNSNGTLSQGSTDQYGYTRASSQGLDLTDAEGGPYSPYTRASNGSLVPVAGNPTSLYSGTLNLPDLQSVVSSPSTDTATNPATGLASGTNLTQMLQSVVAGSPSSSPSQASTSTPSAAASSSGTAAGSTGAVASSTNNDLSADGSNALPSFDQQWFNDHGSQIATAVRAQLLDFHPIVDAINNL